MGESIHDVASHEDADPLLRELAWLIFNLPDYCEFDGLQPVPPLRRQAIFVLVSIGYANCRFSVVLEKTVAGCGETVVGEFEMVGTGDDSRLFYDAGDACCRLAAIDPSDRSVTRYVGEQVFLFGLRPYGDRAKRELSVLTDLHSFFEEISRIKERARINPEYERVRSSSRRSACDSKSATAVATATASVGDINVQAPDFGPLAEALREITRASCRDGETLQNGHIPVPADSLDETDWKILDSLLRLGPMNQDTLHREVHHVNTGKDRAFSDRIARLKKFKFIAVTTGQSAETSIAETGRKALTIRGNE